MLSRYTYQRREGIDIEEGDSRSAEKGLEGPYLMASSGRQLRMRCEEREAVEQPLAGRHNWCEAVAEALCCGSG